MEVLASVSEGVLGALAEKLRGLLGDEYALQAGVRGDIDFLQSELQRMEAFLLDYARCQTTTALVKDWAREVQELAYDFEDAVDDFTHRVGPAPASTPAKVAYFVSTLMARRQIAEQARSLRARALEVSERRKRYDYAILPPSDASSSSLRLPPTVYAELANQSNMVGLDGPREDIIGKLMDAGTKDASGRRRVASMVGFAGVGKTTMAMALYLSLGSRFQCRAFVTVSRKFDVRRVLKDILQQVMMTTCSDPAMAGVETLEVRQLVGKLRENLQDKRYLIIIDDLWEISAWEDISHVLPENNLDCIIITTTRNESVADACCSRYHPGHFVHRVESLKDHDARTLFLGRIFGSEDNYPHDLEEVSLKILKKCSGLPLAIVCISSLLAATQPQATKWEKVHKSLGSEIDSNDNLRSLKQALKLGYDDLPQHLKVCLLYLSAFPEDRKIQRERLTRRWIAEGFIAEKPGMSLQEVAESYFSELIERSMIQAVDVDCFGEVHACRIHDVMFELISMQSFEENFVTLIGDNRCSASRQWCNVRRLSLDCTTAADGLDLSSFNMSHARSLTIYGHIDNIPSIPECRFLRTLDFECCEGVDSRHLMNIGDLFMLKYLSLKSTWISKLPWKIGEMKCLETLDLTQTNIRELPVEITRLKRLVHLLAGGAELPQGVGNMGSLQTLCIRAASKKSKEAVKELVRLTSLRKLDMSYLHPTERRSHDNGRRDASLPWVISNLGKCKLQSLHLNLLGYSMGLFLDIQLFIAPPPVLLQSLRIRVVGEDLETLEKLPRLVRFRLTLKEPSRQGIVFQRYGFPCLKELFINCRIMPILISQGAMSKLEKFELKFHAYRGDLRCVKFSIEHLYSLKEFRFAIVGCRGLSDPDVEYLKEAFKDAVLV
ncbi:disease resistance protein Pik-2-like isoform X2 [Phragmites australis]|uniref:disease resistance protein Pik-2-like isoform X2 n=1 Tax=Phragmites australis TaxID=29695 RepID=UPI002D79240A|nr:disease resistance protein Pik-2-like isoform X2 [Phragmites australis]